MSDSLMGSIALEDQKIRPIIEGSTLIGGIYYMNYDECVIVSNDRWKDDAGGIPRHCYLLATATNWDNPEDFNEDDAYAILLRAKGPAKLPTEDDLMEVRAEAMRKKVTNQSDNNDSPVPGSSEDVMDVLTRNEIQFSGIEAKILGTLYEEDNEITFGSDVDTFYSSARYEVYKPGPASLAKIMSLQTRDDNEGVRIGRVRYSSTERNPISDEARVPIDIEDVIGSKTAVFGMTRTGKSNTMKILATAIFEHAAKNDREIGQLLFDPAGEYANPNEQDEVPLRRLSPNHVTIYQWGETDTGIEAKSLKMNFFNEDFIKAVWSEINNHVPDDAGYKRDFKETDVVGPDNREDNWGAYYRAQRRRSALYATLLRAGFRPPSGLSTSVQAHQVVRDIVEEESGLDLNVSNGTVYLDADQLESFWKTVAEHRERINEEYRDETGKSKDWVDTQLEHILIVFNQETGRGYRILDSARKYHDPRQSGYYAEDIYDDLTEGKMVIIDMSTGTESAIKVTSETVIRFIFNKAVRRFTADKDLYDIQIYLEEAHQQFTLFGNLAEHVDGDTVNQPMNRCPGKIQ